MPGICPKQVKGLVLRCLLCPRFLQAQRLPSLCPCPCQAVRVLAFREDAGLVPWETPGLEGRHQLTQKQKSGGTRLRESRSAASSRRPSGCRVRGCWGWGTLGSFPSQFSVRLTDVGEARWGVELVGAGARRGRGGNGPSGEFPENASPLSFLLGGPGWRPRGGAQPGWLSAHGSEWTRGGGWRCSGGGLSLHTLALTLLWVPWLPPPHREAVHGPALAPAHSPSVPRGAWGTLCSLSLSTPGTPTLPPGGPRPLFLQASMPPASPGAGP